VDRSEVDIELDRAHWRSADAALRRAGFEVLEARGIGPHRFYLAFAEGGWIKLDAKLAPAHQPRALARKLARRLPLSVRRAGPVVALVGPDGAGKGTIIEHLRAQIPLAVDVLYLGWRPRRGRPAEALRAESKRGALRECAGLLRGHLRSARILLRGYAAAWRGTIVLCDRHPLEVLATRPHRTRTGLALERLLARRLTPWPDRIVLLDAPAEVLGARKEEQPAETLERWRADYRHVFGADSRTALVSTAQALEASVAEASAVVWSALAERRRWAS